MVDAMAADQFHRIALVVNAVSRSGNAAYDRARHRLSDLGVTPAESYPVRDPARLGDVLDSVLASGCDLVIIGGGDGTLGTGVDRLAHRGVTLGVIPLGTANDLARTLQIPADVDAACATIADGRVVDIDVGRMGDHTFCNVASLGLAVGVTKALTPRLKHRLGPLAYPVATLRAYRRHRPFTTTSSSPTATTRPCGSTTPSRSPSATVAITEEAMRSLRRRASTTTPSTCTRSLEATYGNAPPSRARCAMVRSSSTRMSPTSAPDVYGWVPIPSRRSTSTGK